MTTDTLPAFPSSFVAFNEAFHALESATLGKDSSPALERALHDLGSAQDLFNEDATGFSEEMHSSDVADLISTLNHRRFKLDGWKAMTGAERESAVYLGTIEVNTGDDPDIFEVVALPDRLVFGGACNVGLLESGMMPLSPDSTLTGALEELIEDLEAFYRSKGHVSIYCNDRM